MGASDDLAEQMRLHLTETFHESVEKGRDYGEVDAVTIDADVYGWATRAGSLSGFDRSRLASAAGELERSIGAFPASARPYYERLLKIAHLTLTV